MGRELLFATRAGFKGCHPQAKQTAICSSVNHPVPIEEWAVPASSDGSSNRRCLCKFLPIPRLGVITFQVARDPASVPASSRPRKASMNARTRAGICLRVGKTAHIPTSSGLTSSRTIRLNSPLAICLFTSQ